MTKIAAYVQKIRRYALALGWSPKREAEDFERWVSMVPKKDRNIVRKWLASCGPNGRLEFWELVIEDTMRDPRVEKHYALSLVRYAKESAKAKPFVCEMCEVGQPVATEGCDGGKLICRDCIAPGIPLATRAA